MGNHTDDVAPPNPADKDLASDGGDESITSSRVDATRRKWISAMLAGPAVVSLPATASAAAFGSISRCVDNLYSSRNTYLHIGSGEDDGMARESRNGLLLSKGKAGTSGYQAAVVVEYRAGEYYAPDWRQWYSAGVDGQGRINFVSPTGDQFKSDGTIVVRRTLVFAGVDDFGQFAGIDPAAADWGFVPVTNSCYVSIAPLKV